MVLHLIGMGLGGEDDVTLRGHKLIENCDKVYLEVYTSVMSGLNAESLKKKYGKEVVEADRDLVEVRCDAMIEEARTMKIAFLVVGDPLGATTHTDLMLRARMAGAEVEVVHNASIINAVGITGMQVYRFGQTVSVPYFDKTWRPSSFLDKINENLEMNLHTLVLLDIKVKEQTEENLMRGKPIYEPPRFMTIAQAIQQILCFPEKCKSITRAVGVARVGTPEQEIRGGTLQQLANHEFGPPLHSLVICAPELHEVENQFYNFILVK